MDSGRSLICILAVVNGNPRVEIAEVEGSKPLRNGNCEIKLGPQSPMLLHRSSEKVLCDFGQR